METNIAAIVLNYNNFRDTFKCVDSMLKLGLNVEIIIVDNYSTNDSFHQLHERYANFTNCHILQSGKNKGYSYGNNFGMKYLSKNYPEIKYYVIMNPDTEFDDPMLLTKLSIHLQRNERIGIVAPVMWMHGEACLEKSSWDLPNTLDYLKRQLITYKWKPKQKYKETSEGLYYADVVHGSFFMIRADAVREIGYLDENIFMYGEENLLALMLKEKGYIEAIDLRSKYYHNHPNTKSHSTLSEDIKKHHNGGYHSKRYIWKKYYPIALLPLVDILFCVNVCLLTLSHFKHMVVRSLKK